MTSGNILIPNALLSCLGYFILIFIVVESFNLGYSHIINSSLKDIQNIFRIQYEYQEERSIKFKELLDDFLSHEHDANLDINVRQLIEKEKSGNGYLALNYLRSKVDLSAAHLKLRKIEKLKRVIQKSKKWW